MKNNNSLKVIDLFCGVGGMSLGALRAGFKLACAVDNNPRALEAHTKNLNCSVHLDLDLSETEPDQLLNKASLKESDIIGIIGGPPCQGFSNMGAMNLDDARNNLFHRFFYYVKEINPTFFVAENVEGILNKKYDQIREKAFAQINDSYTILSPISIKASDYGVPTRRTRIFFIGFKKKSNIVLSEANFTDLSNSSESISVENALLGLPENLDDVNNGTIDIPSDALKTMKDSNLYYYKRIYDNIPPDCGDSNAVKAYQKSGTVSGFNKTLHTEKVKKRFKTLKHGERDSISKMSRLNPEGVAPTLLAGTGPERGSHQALRPIHPSEPRVITPREAARLQGFPDWFVFDKTIWHSFMQIGNSVSPILAEKILSVIYHKLT